MEVSSDIVSEYLLAVFLNTVLECCCVVFTWSKIPGVKRFVFPCGSSVAGRRWNGGNLLGGGELRRGRAAPGPPAAPPKPAAPGAPNGECCFTSPEEQEPLALCSQAAMGAGQPRFYLGRLKQPFVYNTLELNGSIIFQALRNSLNVSNYFIERCSEEITFFKLLWLTNFWCIKMHTITFFAFNFHAWSSTQRSLICKWTKFARTGKQHMLARLTLPVLPSLSKVSQC